MAIVITRKAPVSVAQQIDLLDQLEQPVQPTKQFKSVATMDSEFQNAKQSTGIEWTQAHMC